MIIPVNLGSRSYSIVVEGSALATVGARLAALGVGARAALVSDGSILRLYGKTVTRSLESAGFGVAPVEVPEGEAAKTLAVAEGCWDELLAAGLDRTSTVLALGGGAVGDLAGFVAATYMRGVNFVQLPTTVLAQVDASIGGKTAIDHPKAKNLIGAFHQPRLVLVDPAVVRTLPERDFRSGLAEIVKHGAVLDAGYFADVERDAASLCARELPALERIISTYTDGSLRKPLAGMTHAALDQAVVTFAGLLDDTDFLRQIRDMLRLLQEGLGTAVDVEFAHDGKDLYILQCRPQSSVGDDRHVAVPAAIPAARKIFSAHKYVTNAQITGVRYVVYVDPTEYGQLHTWNDMVAVGEIVSRLNALLPRRSFILVGPGRWGSRGDITLGVRVTYADISNTLMIVEVARKRGSYVPDLSFGTHFFQDLVEARIRYLALYPDEAGEVFNEEFFLRSPSLLVSLLPEYAYLEHVVRVIDVAQVAEGCELQVMMDGERDEALAFLAEVGSRPRQA